MCSLHTRAGLERSVTAHAVKVAKLFIHMFAYVSCKRNLNMAINKNIVPIILL